MIEKIELFKDKTECCACGACENICSQNAIEMREDEVGFLYPYINKDKCISCGACMRVCGYKKANENNDNSDQFVIAFSSKDDSVMSRSASGGAFAEIAKEVLNESGVVYGAVSEDRSNGWTVHHSRIDKMDDLKMMQGSKYVQSDMGNIYKQVRKDLDDGQKVLFSGTPCQVDGLNNYLMKKYDNLLTVDIICHGVPNQRMYKDFLSYRENHIDGTIERFVFRDKSKGQGMISRMDIKTNNLKSRSIIKKGELYSYFYLFLKQHIYRTNCYSCPYAKQTRYSDITIGDFWGFSSLYPNMAASVELTDSKGVSCVIVNSEKGMRAVDNIKQHCNCMESTFEMASKYNGQLKYPSRLTGVRQNIIDVYADKGYAGIEHFYHTHFWKDRIKYFISSLIPMKVKKKAKSLLG
ncbi:Coenzyme F420 hydrogenase/dehydrogenase, beta subunit C-terminal domain [Butyrivibrio sp. AD3002]|uniref:Coenzyme F420 hydrogenase/dehydrogenase, beta subunit C-terminal domain n=1 Tax=Butyrivibrio sp. AD3002 TaxID=1280670 RepID=UPI0003B2F31D|nr:Coenzyme F420 hydrogenase/dehydrogenase, beta subunit C-terminal domain [Butyrivibrio sp. AD3002]